MIKRVMVSVDLPNAEDGAHKRFGDLMVEDGWEKIEGINTTFSDDFPYASSESDAKVQAHERISNVAAKAGVRAFEVAAQVGESSYSRWNQDGETVPLKKIIRLGLRNPYEKYKFSRRSTSQSIKGGL